MVIRTLAHSVRRRACGAVVLWLAVALAVIEGYPTGAPGDDAACSDMVPRHSDSLPQDNRDFVPVTIATNIRSDTEDYTAVRVTIQAKRGRRFRGFFLQARHVAGSRAIGSFIGVPASSQCLDCFGSPNSAVTHSNRRRKSSISAKWQTFNRTEAANVIFVATIVESFDTFWVNVSSDVLFGVSSDVPITGSTLDPGRLAGERNKTINISSTPTLQSNDKSTVDDGFTSPTVFVTSLNVTQPITNTSDGAGITNSSEAFSSAAATSETPVNSSAPSTQPSGLSNRTSNSFFTDVDVTSVDAVNTSTKTPVNFIATVDYSDSTSRNISNIYTSQSVEVTPSTRQEDITTIDTVTGDFVRTKIISTENNDLTTVSMETDRNTAYVLSTNTTVSHNVSEMGSVTTGEGVHENVTLSVTTLPIRNENSSVSMTSSGDETTGYSNDSLSLTSTLNTPSNNTGETITNSAATASSSESSSSVLTAPSSTTETSLSSPSTQSMTTSEPAVVGNTNTVNDTIEMSSTVEGVTIATTNETVNSTLDATESGINSRVTTSTSETTRTSTETSPSTPLLTTQDDVMSTADNMMTSPQTSISSSTSQSTNSQTVVRRSTPQETRNPSLDTTASANYTESLTTNVPTTDDSVATTDGSVATTDDSVVTTESTMPTTMYVLTTDDSVATTGSTVPQTMNVSTTDDSVATTESTMSTTMYVSTTDDSVAATDSTVPTTMNVSLTNDSVAATVTTMLTGMPVTNSSVGLSEATTADVVTTDAATSDESLSNSTAILTSASLTTTVSPMTTNGSLVQTTAPIPTSTNNSQSELTTDLSVDSSTSGPEPTSASISTERVETSTPTTNSSPIITTGSFARTPSDSPVSQTNSQTVTESEITTESKITTESSVTTMQPEPNSTSVTVGEMETSSAVTNSSGIVTNRTSSTSLSPRYTPAPTDSEMTTDATIIGSTSDPAKSASRAVSANSPLVGGTSESNFPSGETTTAQPIVEDNNEVLLRFRIGQRPFTEDLTRPDSAEYQSLADEVVDTMWDVYRNTDNLDSINIVRFLRGSVIPEVQLVFGSQLDDNSKLGVVDVLYTTVQTSGGQLGNFTVDSVSAVDENGAFDTIDACFLLPCPPGAYCFVDSNDGQCWLTCFRNDDYCLNGGACVDPTGDATVATCRCVNNFEGTRCEIEGEPIDTNTGTENLTLLILAAVCGILALLFLILLVAMVCWCVRSRSRKTGRFEEDSEKVDKWRQNSLEREESFRKVEAVAGTSFTKTDQEPQKPSRMLIVIPSDDESSGSGFYLTDSDSDSEHLIRPKMIEGGASFPYFDNLHASIPDLLSPVADYEMDIMNHMANRPLSDSVRRRSVSFSDFQQVITDDDRIGFENFSFGDNKKGGKGGDGTNDNFQVRWDFKVGESGVEEQETAA